MIQRHWFCCGLELKNLNFNSLLKQLSQLRGDNDFKPRMFHVNQLNFYFQLSKNAIPRLFSINFNWNIIIIIFNEAKNVRGKTFARFGIFQCVAISFSNKPTNRNSLRIDFNMNREQCNILIYSSYSYSVRVSPMYALLFCNNREKDEIQTSKH